MNQIKEEKKAMAKGETISDVQEGRINMSRLVDVINSTRSHAYSIERLLTEKNKKSMTQDHEDIFTPTLHTNPITTSIQATSKRNTYFRVLDLDQCVVPKSNDFMLACNLREDTINSTIMCRLLSNKQIYKIVSGVLTDHEYIKGVVNTLYMRNTRLRVGELKFTTTGLLNTVSTQVTKAIARSTDLTNELNSAAKSNLIANLDIEAEDAVIHVCSVLTRSALGVYKNEQDDFTTTTFIRNQVGVLDEAAIEERLRRRRIAAALQLVAKEVRKTNATQETTDHSITTISLEEGKKVEERDTKRDYIFVDGIISDCYLYFRGIFNRLVSAMIVEVAVDDVLQAMYRYLMLTTNSGAISVTELEGKDLFQSDALQWLCRNSTLVRMAVDKYSGNPGAANGSYRSLAHKVAEHISDVRDVALESDDTISVPLSSLRQYLSVRHIDGYGTQRLGTIVRANYKPVAHMYAGVRTGSFGLAGDVASKKQMVEVTEVQLLEQIMSLPRSHTESGVATVVDKVLPLYVELSALNKEDMSVSQFSVLACDKIVETSEVLDAMYLQNGRLIMDIEEGVGLRIIREVNVGSIKSVLPQESITVLDGWCELTDDAFIYLLQRDGQSGKAWELVPKMDAKAYARFFMPAQVFGAVSSYLKSTRNVTVDGTAARLGLLTAKFALGDSFGLNKDLDYLSSFFGHRDVNAFILKHLIKFLNNAKKALTKTDADHFARAVAMYLYEDVVTKIMDDVSCRSIASTVMSRLQDANGQKKNTIAFSLISEVRLEVLRASVAEFLDLGFDRSLQLASDIDSLVFTQREILYVMRRKYAIGGFPSQII